MCCMVLKYIDLVTLALFSGQWGGGEAGEAGCPQEAGYLQEAVPYYGVVRLGACFCVAALYNGFEVLPYTTAVLLACAPSDA